jgi:hypothetical protein
MLIRGNAAARARAEARSEKPAASTIGLSQPLSTKQCPALMTASLPTNQKVAAEL